MDPVRPWKTSWVLGLLFSAVFALAVGALALLLRFGVEAGFQTYLDTTQAGLHGRIMGALESLPPVEGAWDKVKVANLGRQALDQGLVLSLQDGEGLSVWSARIDAPQAVDEVFATLERRLQARVPWDTGRWEAWDHPVETTSGVAGSMTLEVFQPRRLGPSDLAFLQALDQWLVAVALAGVVLSLILGTLAARGLVRPLQSLQSTTRRLGSGDYEPPRATQTPFREVQELEADLALLASRLAHLQNLRDTAGADTAHELRTPLANLEAQLEGLEDGVLAPTPERFQRLVQEVRRLGELVQAWEDWEKARQPSPTGCQRPREVVESVVESFRPRTETRGQTLALSTESSLPPLSVGRVELARVVVNLVENAHRATPPGGSILVGLRPVLGGVELTVDDTGPGIPEAHRDAVFDRFYRVDPSRSRESGGLGLGLSLVKALIEGAKGRVAAEVSPEGGCRIRAFLPELS